MKLNDLRASDELHRESMKDPEYRHEWARTQLAHEVALRVLQYRVGHNLIQTRLAAMLDMRQPHVARLETGDHEPSLATLSRLSRVLGLEFHIDITPETLALSG
jgi:ribosome-binding protein aMBF1 (putative translation factor)